MSGRRLGCALAIVAAIAATAGAAADPAPPRPAARAPGAARDADRAFLLQLAKAQRTLNEQLVQLKERIDWLYYEVTLRRDEHAGIDQAVRAMREEVKGLYVESSGVKEAIEALKADVAAVDSNVSGFRTFSGLFIALVLLLLAVIFAMTVRR